jgi:hypothetical protein
MNRHQVLTGAANNLDHSVSIGSVENNHFTVRERTIYFNELKFFLNFIKFSKGIWIGL